MCRWLALLLPLAAASGHRRIDVVNACDRPMIIAPTGGNSQIACGSSGCPEGMTCSPHSHECYFDFERPGEDWTIAPGERLTMYTPNEAVRQGNGVLADWSGKMEFYPNHTEDKGSIPSAFCNDRDFCPPYQGLNGVATAVEFTLVPHGPDFYDVSVINGFNVPIEMKPNGQFARVTEEAAGSHKGYSCGAAGAFRQEDGRLSSCPWDFQPVRDGLDLGPLLRQVDGNGVPCNSSAECGERDVCGQVGVRVVNPVTQHPQPTTEIRMECGSQIGLWSAYQLCVWSGNTYVSPAPFEGLIDCPAHHQMFACAGPAPWTTTCYAKGPHPSGCCGCGEWEELLGTSVPKSHEGCQGSDPRWLQHALPFLEILKKGCPTAYTYAFDDESSTFTCQSLKSREGSEVNSAEYIITLCKEKELASEKMSDLVASSLPAPPVSSLRLDASMAVIAAPALLGFCCTTTMLIFSIG
ncbi:unnamed protein product [Effrenium voratum]|uniref:Osmotin, thaumatin-like protein n=1 Tax=Effrenium voratum TaxID=2562239 RepID=A0AA36HT53_9DINO|nr:unnamed protein product [Effrenium voratum]